MGGVLSTQAQTDVTDTYITNAGFDTETDFQTENVSTGNSNQRKDITGWSHSGGSTYTTGAAIGFGTSGQINGANLPATNSDGSTIGGALTLNAAWQSEVWYSQEVTLPAGNYSMKFMVNNVGKNGEWNNDPPLFTFTTPLNIFAGNVNSYPVNSWTEQTIGFALASETTGTIKIGYKAGNNGSGNTPKLIVDYVKAFYNSNYTATLQSAIDRAARLYTRTSDSDLNSAIISAQNVLKGAGTDVAYQATIDGAVTTLRSAIITAQNKLVLEGEEDITYLLENANFESSPALTGGICTYAYDCGKNGVFYSQMQQVEGWEVVGNANGKAAGVLAYGSNTWIAGESYKATSVTSSIEENNALALVGAWSSSVQYKQTVTLPAGVYALTVPVFNSNGGTAISKNLIGFITNTGKEYLAETTSYPVGSTKTETINFTLEEETEGYISLGYTAGNTGSGNCPKMFIDAITIKYFTADKSELFDKLEEAQTYQDVLNNSDLAAAISTAQEVYNNGQALQSAVDAQVTALGNAITNALTSIANGTNVTTLFVKNNSFEEGSDNWSFNIANDTGVKDNSNTVYTTTGVDGTKLFNTWGGSEAKYVKQTLTGLPDGYYVISALVASDEGVDVTLYVDEGTNAVPASYTGKGLFVEGMAGAVQPVEGTLEIGANATNWYKVDNFQLFYFDNETDALAAVTESNLTNTIANYNFALTAAKGYFNEAITGKEKVDLDVAIAADDALDKTDIDAVKNAYSELKNATTVYVAAAVAYERAAYAISMATDTSVDATDLTVLKTTETTEAADLTDPTNTLLAAVINSYAPGEFGFENGQYAPYNNVEGLTLLEVADAVASKTTDEITTTITSLQADALWTINTEDVDAIYNGSFSSDVEGDWGLTGWTRTNSWGQQKTGVSGDYTTAYYNQPGSLKYGETGVYTMPLAANTIYKLTVAYRSNENNSNKGMTVSILNAEDGLTAATFTGNGSTSSWKNVEAYFTTGAAGNYVLTLANNGNTWMTNVSLLKVASSVITINESAAFNFTCPETYADVTLNRTIKADTWNTFCVPFDITNEELVDKFGAEVAVAEFSDEGESEDEVTVNFNTMATPAITANKPVLLKGNEGTSFNFSGKLIKDGEAKVAGTYFDFVGNYEIEKTIAEGDYFIASNKLYKSAGATTIDGTRAYIKAKVAGARIANFAIEGAETTGISVVEAGQNAQNSVFDLQGRRVAQPAKGLYIKNGKKVVIK